MFCVLWYRSWALNSISFVPLAFLHPDPELWEWTIENLRLGPKLPAVPFSFYNSNVKPMVINTAQYDSKLSDTISTSTVMCLPVAFSVNNPPIINLIVWVVIAVTSLVIIAVRAHVVVLFALLHGVEKFELLLLRHSRAVRSRWDVFFCSSFWARIAAGSGLRMFLSVV